MKELPILFRTEMVQAILSGNKCQTRRIIKPQPVIDDESGYVYFNKHKYLFDIHNWKDECLIACKYQINNLLWVKETYQHTECLNINPQDENYGYVYKADGQPWDTYEGWKWKPSIFMPKSAARIWLQVESVRVERLQDISAKDSVLEGCCNPGSSTPKLAYEMLWESINGSGSWEKNPYVWVITFKRINP